MKELGPEGRRVEVDAAELRELRALLLDLADLTGAEFDHDGNHDAVHNLAWKASQVAWAFGIRERGVGQ